MPVWRVLTRVDATVPGAGTPLDQRVADRATAQALARTQRGRPGVVRASVHLCSHAAGESATTWWDCRTDPRAQYEEV